MKNLMFTISGIAVIIILLLLFNTYGFFTVCITGVSIAIILVLILVFATLSYCAIWAIKNKNFICAAACLTIAILIFKVGVWWWL